MIRYAHILHAVYAEPWLILPSAHGAIVEVLHSRLFSDQPQSPAVVFSDGKTEAETVLLAAGETKLETGSRFAPVSIDEDGIATIHAAGVISKSASAFEKSCFGGVGPQDITASLRAAMADERVRGMILELNSPGGTVTGVAEAADVVASIGQLGEKPLVVWTDEQACSAAYWIAAGASGIYAARFAYVGSIGVYRPWVDASFAAAQQGYKVQVFKSGKFKAAGYPGTELTREQEDQAQAEVDRIGKAFRAHVAEYRPDVPQDAMEGQSFSGEDATEKGLTDGVFPAIESVKARLIAAL